MCGFIGVIGRKNDPRLIMDLIKHRGPDYQNTWQSCDSEFPVQFGHARLAILDLTSASNQPLLLDNGRYIFIYNGEVFNYLELKKELEKEGFSFTSTGDTEVFARGLIEYGPNFQLKCNGMWSFCLWDQKTKSAILGRDRFGIKPLYYSLRSGYMVVCSEMKGIYPFLDSIKPRDDINIHFQKIFDYESSSECVIEGINRVKPGHYLIYQDQKLSTFRWWNTLNHISESTQSYDEQVEIWRELFLDSVSLRMRSDVPIGTALSGGLDSSATICAMSYLTESSQITTEWKHPFCSHFPNSSLDELKWAKTVADYLQLDLNIVEIDPNNSNWTIDKSLFQVEDPYITLPIPMLETYRAISEKGIKVTLDGHGADELFSGYGHIVEAFKFSNPTEAVQLDAILRSLKSGTYEINNRNKYSVWLKSFLHQRLKTIAKEGKKKMLSLISPDEVDFIRFKSNHEDFNHPAYLNMNQFDQKLYEIFHITILPTLLRNYDRYSMASGVEIRMPFMDYRLVNYTFSLPWTSKIGNTFTKRIMRDALINILPESVRTRRDKIGWNSPLHEWLKGPLREEVQSLIDESNTNKDVKISWNNFQKLSGDKIDYSAGERMYLKVMPMLWEKSIKTNK